MPKRSSSADANQIAARIVADATDEGKGGAKKNPAAVALGRLGGLKGGVARASKLSAKRRKQIAKRAAAARWSKPKS